MSDVKVCVKLVAFESYRIIQLERSQQHTKKHNNTQPYFAFDLQNQQNVFCYSLCFGSNRTKFIPLFHSFINVFVYFVFIEDFLIQLNDCIVVVILCSVH